MTQELLRPGGEAQLRSYFGLHSPGDKWRHWLAHTGPIIARFEIDKAFNDATAASAVIDAYTEETGYGGHALSIVGYTKNHFIVRNSWGSTWGDPASPASPTRTREPQPPRPTA